MDDDLLILHRALWRDHNNLYEENSVSNWAEYNTLTLLLTLSPPSYSQTSIRTNIISTGTVYLPAIPRFIQPAVTVYASERDIL